MTGKQVEYTSVPYKSILAFSIETAGSVDTDQELKLYAHGIGKVSIDLVKSIDVMPIYRFLNSVIIQGKMAGKHADGAVVFDSGAQMVGSSTSFFDIFGSNYAQVDKKMVESSLKSNPNILLDDEKVELAFKCGRDSFVLTSCRLLKIDGQGITGKKGEFKKWICELCLIICIVSHFSSMMYCNDDSGIPHDFVAGNQRIFK